MEESSSVREFLMNRSPETYSPVVDEHIGMLRKFIYRIILNEHDTDDIAQEVFLAAYNKISSFKAKSKFSTWLCRIACNKSFELIRKRKKTFVTDGQDCPEFRNIKTFKTPERSMISDETQNRVMTAISSLPEHLRTTIVLTAIEGKDPDEAAYILNCTKATFYWRIHKARKILKKELGDCL